MHALYKVKMHTWYVEVKCTRDILKYNKYVRCTAKETNKILGKQMFSMVRYKENVFSVPLFSCI